jgi:hypothetical protein
MKKLLSLLLLFSLSCVAAPGATGGTYGKEKEIIKFAEKVNSKNEITTTFTPNDTSLPPKQFDNELQIHELHMQLKCKKQGMYELIEDDPSYKAQRIFRFICQNPPAAGEGNALSMVQKAHDHQCTETNKRMSAIVKDLCEKFDSKK